ncbi:MAG TPA: 4-alpha-glucanotransferase [Polyangiaceae bacterium]
MRSSELLAEARAALGIDQLVLAIHDSSFPGVSGEDVGRGSPYSRGAEDLFRFARELGFTGVQLGPQGETSAINRSPYDGTIFAKSVLSVDLRALEVDPELGPFVDRARVEDLVRRTPRADRVQYAHAFAGVRAVVGEAWRSFERSAPPALRARYEAFRAEQDGWLTHDEAYERATGYLELGEAFAFGQMIVHAQHEAMRRRSPAGWTVYGDFQVGLSHCDRWGRDDLFVPGYAMGAPPSRTDPEGQAWGYPVFDPFVPAATALLEQRVAKMLREMDGLRIDHPHGFVCPWVYDVAAPDALLAVKGGARLFDSPDLPDHPRLAPYAIARPSQLDRGVPRYAEGWVRELDDAQVGAYSERIDRIVEAVQRGGHGPQAIVCEVLSTQPYPLARVMARHGLGRFRVTQKANPVDRGDVYRSSGARAEDWIMVGNHDTPPLLAVVERWQERGTLLEHARYLEGRLRLADGALATPAEVTQAMFADLFVGPARQVMVFVADVFGTRDVYNRPGVVDDVNWTWRVPEDFRRAHRESVARGEALDVPRALAAALQARAPEKRELREGLLAMP